MAVRHSTLSVAESAKLTHRATAASMSVATILILLKLGAWWASGSVAMLASLADSALDLLASAATFFAVRYAAAPPDAEHRFGHGKAEAFASLMQAGLVFASAALIGREAIARIGDSQPLRSELWAMGVMLVSVGLTSVLIAIQSSVLKSTGSVAVSGDRAHYAADFASNIVALIGIALAAWLDRPWIDAAAGFLVAAWLVWGAIGVFREASLQLMDHELSDEARAQILALATEDPRIKGIHQLRTRASGPVVHMQMHADMDPDLTLVEAHQAMIAAERRLLEAFPSADIIIHPDPRGRAESHGGPFGEREHDEIESTPS
ncbi:MAG TPA: cation diffusion facilitator family transporter [Caulobacteraceae bacterium]|nr:cation diffusion facilitator family transporter [Caulobacteraceae bacterium]